MKSLFWTPILIDVLALCILWETVKFMWTGRTQWNIMVGQETKTLIISKGESYEKDKEEFQKARPPFGEAGKDFRKRQVQNADIR